MYSTAPDLVGIFLFFGGKRLYHFYTHTHTHTHTDWRANPSAQIRRHQACDFRRLKCPSYTARPHPQEHRTMAATKTKGEERQTEPLLWSVAHTIYRNTIVGAHCNSVEAFRIDEKRFSYAHKTREPHRKQKSRPASHIPASHNEKQPHKWEQLNRLPARSQPSDQKAYEPSNEHEPQRHRRTTGIGARSQTPGRRSQRSTTVHSEDGTLPPR